jgi:hypothetical protein
MRESKDYAMALSGGLGFATLDPFYLFLNPKFHNMWGTAWDFEVLGHYGFSTQQRPGRRPVPRRLRRRSAATSAASAAASCARGSSPAR